MGSTMNLDLVTFLFIIKMGLKCTKASKTVAIT